MTRIGTPQTRSPRGGILLAGLVTLVAALAAAPARGQTLSFFEEQALWEEHFSRIPDPAAKGSGFKPYQRWAWFYGSRVDENGRIPPGARWNAHLEKERILAAAPERLTAVWTSLGPTNIAGRCQPIAIDPTNPNRMLVGSASGGLWETVDAGMSWSPVDDRLPSLAVGALLFDIFDPTIVYMGTGEGNNSADSVFGVGVMVSTDRGLTWSILGSGMNWTIADGKAVNALAQSELSGALLAATTDGIYRLVSGVWTRTLAGTGTSILSTPGSPGTFYCAIGSPWGSGTNGIYISTDDGLTWTRLTNGLPASHGRLGIAICESQPAILYAGISTTGGALLGIYKTQNAGASWSLVYNAANHYNQQGWYDLVIVVDPTNPNKVYSGGVDIWASTNGGASFTRRTRWDNPPGHPQYVHADQHGWAFHPDNPAHVYAATDGGVFESYDSGVSWTEISTGMTTMQFYDIDVSQTKNWIAMGGTQDNGTNIYTGSSTWYRSLGGDGFHCNIDYAKPDTMYMEYYYGNHYRSYNRGLSYTRIMSGIDENGAWDTPVHLDYDNTAILYTAHRRIFKTTNRGNQWTAKTAVLSGLGRSITQSPANQNVLYAAYSASRNIHISTDRGETWNQVAAVGLTTRTMTRIKAHPTNPAIVYVTTSGFALDNVWKSVDWGATFVSISGNLPAVPVDAIEIDPDDPDIIYVGTDLGVWRTEDAGLLWLPYGTGLPNTVVGDLKIMRSERLLRAGTYGRGLWEAPLKERGAASVQESAAPGAELALLDVSPNPLATDIVTVRFALPKGGRVRVQLHDVAGRLIEAPFDDQLEAGTHRIAWPSRAPNGVYFVRIRQEHDTAAGKLTIRR